MRDATLYQIEQLWIEYSTWRHGQDNKVQSSTIRTELSHINTEFHKLGINMGIRILMKELHLHWKGIDFANKYVLNKVPKGKRRPILDPINFKMIEMLNVYSDKLMFALAQQAFLRASEYCYTSAKHHILINDLKFIPDIKNPTRLDILLRSRKNDQLGIYKYQLYFQCTCRTHLPCVLHLARLTLAKRYHLKHEPVFINAKNRACPTSYVNKLIDKLCQPLQLDSRYYSSHSLKRGGATQARINGFSIDWIQTRGAWRSREICKQYISTDLIDIGKFVDNPYKWQRECKERNNIEFYM